MTKVSSHVRPCVASENQISAVDKFDDQNILRKRERNKAVAKKARLKAKSLLLQRREELSALLLENKKLRTDLRLNATPVLSLESLLSAHAEPPDIIKELLRPFQGGADLAYCVSSTIRDNDPIVYPSPGFCQLTKLPASQIHGRELSNTFGCTKEDVFSANTVTVPVSDGTRVPCSLNVAPLKDFTGRTFLLLAVLTPL